MTRTLAIFISAFVLIGCQSTWKVWFETEALGVEFVNGNSVDFVVAYAHDSPYACSPHLSIGTYARLKPDALRRYKICRDSLAVYVDNVRLKSHFVDNNAGKEDFILNERLCALPVLICPLDALSSRLIENSQVEVKVVVEVRSLTESECFRIEQVQERGPDFDRNVRIGYSEFGWQR
jgi:hypothetical protein